jgi:hypothetical protein
MEIQEKRATITLIPDGEELHGTGLFQIGERETYTDLTALGSRLVFLGAAENCHLRVDDPYVSGRQVMMLFERGAWTVSQWPEARNPTYLDGALLEGTQPLMRGSVLRVGCSSWVVTSDAPHTGEFFLRARNLVEFCVAAYRAYGTTRRAAKALGMNDRTFRRRLALSPEGRQLLAERRPQPRKRHSCDPLGIPVLSGRDTSP